MITLPLSCANVITVSKCYEDEGVTRAFKASLPGLGGLDMKM